MVSKPGKIPAKTKSRKTAGQNVTRRAGRQRQMEESLRRSEAELREAQRVARFGSWSWDAGSDEISWSEEYYRIHGFDPGQPPPGYEEHLKAYAPESAARLDAAVKKCLETGEPYALDLEQIRADGTSRWIAARGEARRDANGQITGLRGTAQDITECKRAEHTLQHSLEQTSHAHRILLALNNASQNIQRAHAMEEVYRAIQEQCSQLGYNTSLFEATGEYELSLIYTDYRLSLIRKVEKLTGISQHGYRFSLRPNGIYQRLLSSGKALHFQNVSQLIEETLPEKLHGLAPIIRDIIKVGPSTFAPLATEDETFGILAITGRDLTEADNPAIAAFANQAAIALQNARLYEAAQKDIAEHRKTNDALQKAEEKYRTIFSESIEGIFQSTLEGKFLTANPALAHMWGYESPEELISSIQEISSQIYADPRRRDEFTQLMRQDGQVYGFEYQVRRKDGGTMWVSENARAVCDEQGNLLYYEGHIEDITERRQAEEKLRESEEKFRKAFMTSPDSININRLEDGMYVSINRGFTQTTGYAENDVLGKTSLDLQIWESPEDRKRLVEELRKNGEANGFEARFRTKDGDIKYGLMSAAVIELNGAPHIISMTHDITEHKRAEERIHRQLERLTTLKSIDQIITSNFDLKISLGMLLTQVAGQLQVDAADILVFNPISNVLEFRAGHGFATQDIERVPIRLGEGHAGRAAMERRKIHVDDLKVKSGILVFDHLVAFEGFVSYYCVPLIARGHIKGVMEIFHRSHLHPEPEWLDFLETLAQQAAIAVDNIELFENLQRTNHELTLAYDATIEGWSRAMDLRDKETEGHTRRVTEMSLELARKLGITEEDLMRLRWGGLLHDIGKIGIPDEILHKAEKLNVEEWKIVKQHPQLAYDMLSSIRYLRSALDIPYCHHEKWDGTGYPRGLKGEQIPLTARIFSVVDVWDALTSDRPYRKAWSKEKTRQHILEASGTFFDPVVVKVFLESDLTERY